MLRGISSVQVCLKEIYNGMGPGSFAMPIDRTRSNGHKLKCKRIYLNIGTCYFFPHWCWSTGTGCPERLWNFLLRDLQKLPSCGPRHPALIVPFWAEVGADGPAILNQSVIMSFHLFLLFYLIEPPTNGDYL